MWGALICSPSLPGGRQSSVGHQLKPPGEETQGLPFESRAWMPKIVRPRGLVGGKSDGELVEIQTVSALAHN